MSDCGAPIRGRTCWWPGAGRICLLGRIAPPGTLYSCHLLGRYADKARIHDPVRDVVIAGVVVIVRRRRITRHQHLLWETHELGVMDAGIVLHASLKLGLRANDLVRECCHSISLHHSFGIGFPIRKCIKLPESSRAIVFVVTDDQRNTRLPRHRTLVVPRQLISMWNNTANTGIFSADPRVIRNTESLHRFIDADIGNNYPGRSPHEGDDFRNHLLWFGRRGRWSQRTSRRNRALLTHRWYRSRLQRYRIRDSSHWVRRCGPRSRHKGTGTAAYRHKNPTGCKQHPPDHPSVTTVGAATHHDDRHH
jgi:hypothetical protein